MSRKTRIVGLGGSLIQHSSSLAALHLALTGARDAGAETETFDVAELDLPMFAPGAADIPPRLRRFVDTVALADGMIWSSPLYHGTISGAFKNALDWLDLLREHDPPFLTDKVVGLISTAGGAQGLQAVNTMEFAVRALRAWAVPLVIPVAQAWQSFDPQGNALDPKVGEQLRALGREVARAAARFSSSPMTTEEAQRAEAHLQPLDSHDLRQEGSDSLDVSPTR